MQGAKINGTTYQRYEISGTDYQEQTSSYIRLWGRYYIGPWTLISDYRFYKSGELTFVHTFEGAQPDANQTEIYQRVDYDLEYSTNNIIAYASLWGALAAVGGIVAIPFPAEPRIYQNIVQSNAYFSIVRAAEPQNQFFAVFWPHVDTSSSAYSSPFTLTALPYSYDGTGHMPPPLHPGPPSPEA